MGVILYTLAVEPELEEIEGAAPWQVLARQMPRWIVEQLNGEKDRGLRFFPFLGMQDGRRRFFPIHQPLPSESLLTLHRQKGVSAVVDGVLVRERLVLRVHDVKTGAIHEVDAEFDARDPRSCAQRIAFELSGVLGLPARAAFTPLALEGRALACWLIARDDLLALEASLVRDDAESFFNAIEEAMRVAPGSAIVRSLALAIASRLATIGVARERIVRCLCSAAGIEEAREAKFLERAAQVVATLDAPRSLPLWRALAEVEPTHESAVLRAASMMNKEGDLAGAARMLDASLAAELRTPAVLALRAEVAERDRDLALRDRLLDLLAKEPLPPARVASALVKHLLRKDCVAEAKALVDRLLAQDASPPWLWFDRARITMLTSEHDEAREALRRCLNLRVGERLRAEAERLLRLLERPDALAELQAVERELAAGMARTALRRCKKLVRSRPGISEAWLLLGTAHQRLGNPWRAQRAFARALQCDPKHGEAHHRLGIVLLQRGRHVESYDRLMSASQLLAHEPSPRLHLAQACALTGRRQQGIDALSEAEHLGAPQQMVAAVRRAFFADAG